MVFPGTASLTTRLRTTFVTVDNLAASTSETSNVNNSVSVTSQAGESYFTKSNYRRCTCYKRYCSTSWDFLIVSYRRFDEVNRYSILVAFMLEITTEMNCEQLVIQESHLLHCSVGLAALSVEVSSRI